MLTVSEHVFIWDDTWDIADTHTNVRQVVNNSRDKKSHNKDKKIVKDRIDSWVKETMNMEFIWDGLRTDTSKASIQFIDFLDGGPWKDWIPAIMDPVFLSQDEVTTSMLYLGDEDLWIVVTWEKEVKFYPYAILNWHEIVNDTIDETYIAVTFCPLCWSAIVFDRAIDDGMKVVNFGVSWKLWQSNLLMYDDATETLWSQARGLWVVGHYVDIKLTHIDSDVMNYKEFTQAHPSWVVLSDDTGYTRNYAQAPYGDYDVNDRLFFPVDNLDARLPKKEILYVVNDNEVSVAFVRNNLRKEWDASLLVGSAQYDAVFDAWNIIVSKSWETLSWYHEMFFSRATHNPKSKNIWMGE